MPRVLNIGSRAAPRPRSQTAPVAEEVNPVANTETVAAENPRAVIGGNSAAMIQELAAVAVKAWKAKNDAIKAAAKADKELEAAMAEAGEKFVAVTTEGGGVIDVTYEGGTRSEIDVDKLHGLVTSAQFLQIVTAAAAKVEAVAGKDVANRCKRTKATDPGVKFAARK